MRQKDASITAHRDLATFIYAIADYGALNDSGAMVNNHTINSQNDLLEWISCAGLHVNPDVKLCNSRNEVIQFCKNAINLRDKLPYDIDGVVVKVNDITIQKQMGFTSRAPK